MYPFLETLLAAMGNNAEDALTDLLDFTSMHFEDTTSVLALSMALSKSSSRA
jgi:hypothetical protein